MRAQALAILTAAILLQAGQVNAEIYKWVDENGQVHYSDRAGAPAADKVKVQAAPPSRPQSTAPTTSLPSTPEQGDAMDLQMEYQQRRDEESARRYQEEQANRLKEEQKRQAKFKQEADAQEQARRKAVVEECKATMHLRICSKGYDAIMEERRRLATDRALADQAARMNNRG
jgi:Skp family chaperone for outer membrane proteins